jgi:hypothetical protein
VSQYVAVLGRSCGGQKPGTIAETPVNIPPIMSQREKLEFGLSNFALHFERSCFDVEDCGPQKSDLWNTSST